MRATILVVACLLVSGCAAKTDPALDQTAPNLILTDVDGNAVVLHEWFGMPILLEIFGVNCSSCAAMKHELVPFHGETADRVRMLSIDLGREHDALGARTVEEVRSYREKHHANWTFALDVENVVPASYPILGRPTLYLIDSEGVLRWSHDGFVPRSDLLDRVASL